MIVSVFVLVLLVVGVLLSVLVCTVHACDVLCVCVGGEGGNGLIDGVCIVVVMMVVCVVDCYCRCCFWLL